MYVEKRTKIILKKSMQKRQKCKKHIGCMFYRHTQTLTPQKYYWPKKRRTYSIKHYQKLSIFALAYVFSTVTIFLTHMMYSCYGFLKFVP